MKHKKSVEELQQIALKYTIRGDFYKGDRGAYEEAAKLGVLAQITLHMPKKVSAKFGKNRIANEELRKRASKYPTRGLFHRYDPNAYQLARIRGILNEIAPHMPKNVCGSMAPNYRWLDEKLREIAKSCKTKLEFVQNYCGAYHSATRRGIRDDICSHMPKKASTSSLEKELLECIRQCFPSAVSYTDYHVKIPGKPHIHRFQIDILIPELNKGIEFDGKYYHSFEYMRKSKKKWPEEDVRNYHQIKDTHFASKGIQLIHVKEEDWIKEQQQSLNKVLEFLYKKD